MVDQTKCYAQVRGSVIRVTRLDACGVPQPGESAVVVSKRLSTITIDEVSDSDTNIRERNFGGELCIVDDAPEQTLGYSFEAALCGVDPALITMFTGQPVVKNAAGDIVGFDAETGIDLDGFGFAVEVWSRIAGAACQAGNGRRNYGYSVFPFIKGGRLGGFSYENGPVSFSIQGAQTRDGQQWGVGPYDVDHSAGVAPFTEGPLFTPLGVNNHFRNILVTVPPPAAQCGASALLAA